MKGRVLAKLLTSAAVALIAIGCSNVSGPPAAISASEIAARDIALSIADPTSGTTQEMTDLGAFFYARGAARGLGIAPWSLFHGSDFAQYFTAGIESGKFTWNGTADDYEMSGTQSVTAGPISGSTDITLDVAFFTSSDASGTGVQIANPSAGLPSTIQSLTYKRQMTGTFSNSLSGLKRQLTSTSSFTVTGLNSGSLGFTVNGTKTSTFTNTYADGTTAKGTLTEAVNQFVVSAVLQASGSYLLTATGTITVTYSATITRADGTSVQVNKTATFTLNGQRTAHVDMDGTNADVDITTGATE